jgi:hypothetical protein
MQAYECMQMQQDHAGLILGQTHPKGLSNGQKKKAVETAFVCTLPGVHMRKIFIVGLYYATSN